MDIKNDRRKSKIEAILSYKTNISRKVRKMNKKFLTKEEKAKMLEALRYAELGIRREIERGYRIGLTLGNQIDDEKHGWYKFDELCSIAEERYKKYKSKENDMTKKEVMEMNPY